MDYIFKLLNKYNSKSFKKLGNNPSALTRFKYLSEVLPNIDKYMVTEKADGERAFLILKETAKYITSSGNFTLDIKTNIQGVFDCELIKISNIKHPILYIFDVLELNGENISKLPFEERHKYLLEVEKKIKEETQIKVKQYKTLSQRNYQAAIYESFKEKRPYLTDGLIFTQLGSDYNKTVNLKWKPPSHLTIDMLVLGERLCVGIDSRAWKRYGFPLPDNYEDLVSILSNAEKIVQNGCIIGNYFPIPFECSLGDYSNIDTIDVNSLKPLKINELNAKILELSWDIKKNKWVFHRIRTDRQNELSLGSYYGNNHKVAELTLQSALNPLTFKDLISSYHVLTQDFYFKKSDDKYKAVRKFNNFVKENIIKQHFGKKVMDLASGKGQDIYKYIQAGVQELYMIEIDINAIDELIMRKYDILGKMFINNIDKPINILNNSNKKDGGCVLHVRKIDLNKNWKKNIDSIQFSPDAIFCNFALHYLVEDKKHMENITNFVSHFLEKNSEFIFTAFNGQDVFNLIRNKKWEIDGRYLLELKNKTNKTFKGFEKIKVLLPCSSDVYEESLINLFELDKKFKNTNTVRIKSDNFSGFLNLFQHKRRDFYQSLTEDDKIFIKLYSYTVYKKIDF